MYSPRTLGLYRQGAGQHLFCPVSPLHIFYSSLVMKCIQLCPGLLPPSLEQF